MYDCVLEMHSARRSSEMQLSMQQIYTLHYFVDTLKKKSVTGAVHFQNQTFVSKGCILMPQTL